VFSFDFGHNFWVREHSFFQSWKKEEEWNDGLFRLPLPLILESKVEESNDDTGMPCSMEMVDSFNKCVSHIPFMRKWKMRIEKM